MIYNFTTTNMREGEGARGLHFAFFTVHRAPCSPMSKKKLLGGLRLPATTKIAEEYGVGFLPPSLPLCKRVGARPRSILAIPIQIGLHVWGAAGLRHKFGPSLQVSASLGAWCPLSTLYEYNPHL